MHLTSFKKELCCPGETSISKPSERGINGNLSPFSKAVQHIRSERSLRFTWWTFIWRTLEKHRFIPQVCGLNSSPRKEVVCHDCISFSHLQYLTEKLNSEIYHHDTLVCSNNTRRMVTNQNTQKLSNLFDLILGSKSGLRSGTLPLGLTALTKDCTLSKVREIRAASHPRIEVDSGQLLVKKHWDEG